MKNFIVFLILCVVIIIPVRLVQSEMIDHIVAEVNNKEIIKLFDLQMEEKFQKAGCLPPFLEGFRSKNGLESFIDEIILSQVGLEQIEKYLASVNRNFGLWVEKRDEWSLREYGDVLQIWSGRLDDFFQKVILLGKVGEEDGKDLKKLIKDWKDLLLADLFFPGESRFSRREDIRKIIRITAEKLDVSFSYVERRFLKRALAERAFDKILGEANAKAQIVPADIRKYYPESFEMAQEKFFEKIKNQKKNDIILKKIQDIRVKTVVGARKDFVEYINDSGYNLHQFGN